MMWKFYSDFNTEVLVLSIHPVPVTVLISLYYILLPTLILIGTCISFNYYKKQIHTTILMTSSLLLLIAIM